MAAFKAMGTRIDMTSEYAFERIGAMYLLIILGCIIGGIVDDSFRNRQVTPLESKGISFNNPYSYLMSASILVAVPILVLRFGGYIDTGLYLSLLRWSVIGICFASIFITRTYPRFFAVFVKRRRRYFGRKRKIGMVAILIASCASFDCFLGGFGVGNWSPQYYSLSFIGAAIFINTSLTLHGLHRFLKTT
ncbi:MAG: hypothetical protein OCC46_01220 [Pseudodesulfovibrio sp.]